MNNEIIKTNNGFEVKKGQTMSKLAIKGGEKVRDYLFPSQNTMDEAEEKALLRVLKTGRPSGYRANKGLHFFGGPEVKALEVEWSKEFSSHHYSIACNSATSGLFIACAAIELKEGDEVIVSPYSMTCSATIPLWFKAIPVYADVEPDYFCVDPESIKQNITPNTKAIIAVDIFGQPCNYARIRAIIREAENKYKKRIWLITDTAQSPGARFGAEFAGTIGDIGVFSFNFGKHMTCGEGGMIMTANLELSQRCRLIMNHAESVMNDYENDLSNEFFNDHCHMIGLNLRMTEFQAAVAREQLKKLSWNIQERRKNVALLNYLLSSIPAITAAQIRLDCTHTYYVAAYLWDSWEANGLHRDKFIEAVKAELSPREGRDGEGVQIGCGYIKPIYMMPFNNDQTHSLHLPVVEDLWRNKLFLTLYHAPNSKEEDIRDVGNAFNKVWKYRSLL